MRLSTKHSWSLLFVDDGVDFDMNKMAYILKEFIGYSFKKLLKIWIVSATIITIITVSIGWNCYQFWKDPPLILEELVGKTKSYAN